MKKNNFLNWIDAAIFEADLLFEKKKQHWHDKNGLCTPSQYYHIIEMLERVKLDEFAEKQYRYELIELSFDRAAEIIEELYERQNYEQTVNNPQKRFLMFQEVFKATL